MAAIYLVMFYVTSWTVFGGKRNHSFVWFVAVNIRSEEIVIHTTATTSQACN